MSQPIDDRVTIRLGPDLAAQLDAYLKTRPSALTRSAVIRDALQDYLASASPSEAEVPTPDRLLTLLHLMLSAQLQQLQHNTEHDAGQVKKDLLHDAKRWRSQQAKMIDYLIES